MIATFERNRSQHCWEEHFAHVWPACCDMLWVEIELVRMPRRNIVAQAWPNNYNIMQHPQMLHEKFDQHPTYRNRVVKRIQHVRPKILWYVALECCDCLTRALNDEKGFWPQGETLKIKKNSLLYNPLPILFFLLKKKLFYKFYISILLVLKGVIKPWIMRACSTL